MKLSVDIICPHCGKQASFEEPFLLLDKNFNSQPEDAKSWGGWWVVERFPTLFPWVEKKRGEGLKEKDLGIVQCSHCHHNQKYTLSWPGDAWWQWEIKGDVLWAWDRQHAQEILEHMKSKIRPVRLSENLRHIPSHFLSAKVKAVKAMEDSLA